MSLIVVARVLQYIRCHERPPFSRSLFLFCRALTPHVRKPQVHPMAGQGLNLGIADADALARAVMEGRRSGTDVGSKTLLGRYEEERKVNGWTAGVVWDGGV